MTLPNPVLIVYHLAITPDPQAVAFTFAVPPMQEVCLRWWLDIRSAPQGTQLALNGWPLPSYENATPYRVDVTDWVRLEDNSLTLSFCQTGTLRGVRLVAVACADGA